MKKRGEKNLHRDAQIGAELLRLKDMVKVGTNTSGEDLFEPTSKGVTKGVMGQFATITAQADKEERLYSSTEQKELLDLLETLRNALTRTQTFPQ